MEECEFENYYKLPKIILDIMSWLCTTRFYENTFKKRKAMNVLKKISNFAILKY